jgi:murein DD-endopeptidase MepM/ murein hydrolase activator NlpD
VTALLVLVPILSALNLRVEPPALFNGAPCLIHADAPERPTGQFLDQPLSFSQAPAESSSGAVPRWTAFCGVPLSTKPGSYRLSVTAGAESATRDVPVKAQAYPVSIVTVEGRYLDPPPDVAKRIEEERAFKDRLFSSRTPERFWATPFRPPVPGIHTSPFGARRTYNGQTRSVHQGLDFRAAPGTPVRAIAAGRVVIARPLYFEGGLVAIDHGEGLFSLYMHLSEFTATEGERVSAGQLIAKSGSTGRSAAPHLHLGLMWRQTMLEPAAALRLGRPPRVNSRSATRPPARALPPARRAVRGTK